MNVSPSDIKFTSENTFLEAGRSRVVVGAKLTWLSLFRSNSVMDLWLVLISHGDEKQTAFSHSSCDKQTLWTL